MNSGDDVKVLPLQNIICGRNSTLKIMNRIKSGRCGDLYSGLLTSKNPADGHVSTELVFPTYFYPSILSYFIRLLLKLNPE